MKHVLSTLLKKRISSLSPSNANTMQNTLRPFSSEAVSHLNMPRPTAVPVLDPWSLKRVAVESLLPSQPHVSSQMDQLDSTPASIPHSSALAPLPRRGCLVDQDVNSDPQNHLLFGVSIDSQSLLMQGGIPGLQNGNDSTAIPYSTSNFLSPSQNDFPLDHTLNSSGCLDDSGYVPPCSDNSDQVNRPPATFVKVSNFFTGKGSMFLLWIELYFLCAAHVIARIFNYLLTTVWNLCTANALQFLTIISVECNG